jgi:hypothetical protein
VLLVTPSLVVERREVDVDALVLHHPGGCSVLSCTCNAMGQRKKGRGALVRCGESIERVVVRRIQ